MTWQADHAFLREHGWRRGKDGLWRTDARGGSFRTRNALAYERGEPTPAQAGLLRWMVAEEAAGRGGPRADVWRGGDLIGYYRSQPGASRYYRADDGWRRAGGTALMRLAERGFVVRAGISYGTSLFALTETGRAAGAPDA